MNIVYIIAYLILWPLYRLLKPTKTIHREHIPDGGALYCCNHTRMSDPLYVAYALGWPRQIHVMAKEEIMHWPVLGLILKWGGILGAKRGGADIVAIKTAMKYLKAGEQLLMFPEGTRHTDGVAGDAKTGCAMLAARTGVPIVPVYVNAEKRWFRRNPVVFGEPYYPQFAGKKPTADDYRVIADDLMVRIKALEAEAV